MRVSFVALTCAISTVSCSYALVVLDNHYLQEIWDLKTHPQLRIADGKVFFAFNQRLCLQKIDAFLTGMGMNESTSTADVSNTNNGDLAACEYVFVSYLPSVFILVCLGLTKDCLLVGLVGRLRDRACI